MSINAPGGCLCGAIRYRITAAPLATSLCHCRSCRLASGAPAVAYRVVKTELAAAAFRDRELPVRPAFLEMAGAYLEYLVEHRAEVAFIEQVKHSTFLSPATRSATAREAKAMYDLLERGKREQLLKPLDTGLMIAFLHGTLRELSWALGGVPARRRAAVRDQIAIVCWDGLKV